jgi:hypothetical protein
VRHSSLPDVIRVINNGASFRNWVVSRAYPDLYCFFLLPRSIPPSIRPPTHNFSRLSSAPPLFPVGRFYLLDTNIISWQPHGPCFVIHSPKELVAVVESYFLGSDKLRSFQWQASIFIRLFHVRASCTHPLCLTDAFSLQDAEKFFNGLLQVLP